MPKLFMVCGYTVYFWSNENGEPIHVHISKGKPTPNATKIWLTKSGGCILASNGSKISKKELNELMEFISAQFFFICAKLDIENPIIRINTAFKGCSSLEKISVLPRIYHN